MTAELLSWLDWEWSGKKYCLLFFIPTWGNDVIWLYIFFKWVETTNEIKICFISMSLCLWNPLEQWKNWLFRVYRELNYPFIIHLSRSLSNNQQYNGKYPRFFFVAHLLGSPFRSGFHCCFSYFFLATETALPKFTLHWFFRQLPKLLGTIISIG